jgi:hypothetical protein
MNVENYSKALKFNPGSLKVEICGFETIRTWLAFAEITATLRGLVLVKIWENYILSHLNYQSQPSNLYF